MTLSLTRGFHILSSVSMVMVLAWGPALAQNTDDDNATDARSTIDWSGNSQNNQVDTTNRPTRFDPQSTIPDSADGSNQAVPDRVVRDRSGTVPDRMGRRVQPARSGPIIR